VTAPIDLQHSSPLARRGQCAAHLFRCRRQIAGEQR